jgi:uncharacterized protein (DUF1800 family)
MDHPALHNKPLACALAAHRFGLGQARCADVGDDAVAWLLAQLGPADAPVGGALASSAQGVRQYAEFIRLQQLERRVASAATASAAATGAAMGAAPTPMQAAAAAAAAAASAPPKAVSTVAESAYGSGLRNTVVADQRSRLITATLSQRPLVERLQLFWSNHFTVSLTKPAVRGLVGAFEREALRPHLHTTFETLLKASVRHAAMLRYLDNDNSAGPESALVKRLARRPAGAEQRPATITGLNENLAREVLELHTLGVSGGGAAYGGWGGYTQADVTALAAVLTGWRVPARMLVADPRIDQAVRFDPQWHQPGAKTVLGRSHAEGPDALDQVLHQLAQHPSTARFVSYKLVRHFVADEPAPALVAQLERTFLDTQGDLPSVVASLLKSPLAWSAQLDKLKTPEEFVISTARVLGLGESAFERAPDGGISPLGQRLHNAASPAGHSDRAEDWLGPDAVWKRVEWATRVADRVGRRTDARALAQQSLGPLLQPSTAQHLDRAADGPQALALLLMAPEFQRR